MKTKTTTALILITSALMCRAESVTNWLITNTNSMARFTNDIERPTIALRLDTVTNWTGVSRDGKELGYVATNHVGIVYYQGATNEFALKTTVSEAARWRITGPTAWSNSIWGGAITNYVIPMPCVTNHFHQGAFDTAIHQ